MKQNFAALRLNRKAVTFFWLVLWLILNTTAAVCFKESGTNRDYTWRYFFAGNTFGPLSVIVLMILYARMNPNLTSAMCVGLGTITVQVTFGVLYNAHLHPRQWLGIGLLTAGVALALIGKGARAAESESEEIIP